MRRSRAKVMRKLHTCNKQMTAVGRKGDIRSCLQGRLQPWASSRMLQRLLGDKGDRSAVMHAIIAHFGGGRVMLSD